MTGRTLVFAVVGVRRLPRVWNASRSCGNRNQTRHSNWSETTSESLECEWILWKPKPNSTLQHANAESSGNILNLGEGRTFWEPLFNVEQMFKFALVGQVVFFVVGSGVVIIVLE